jgi:hypothetical protein
MPLLLYPTAGRRNALLLSYYHPARPQWWIQGQGRFVHKDELEIVSDDLFFKASSSSSAFDFASLSYKWLKSCLGRRYRYPFRLSKARSRLSLRLIPVSFSRWARKRSTVHTVKSCPNSSRSFSMTSVKVWVYASSAYNGRPLRGLIASPSIPQRRQRLNQT